MRKALEWLGGSCLIYGLMAACSGAPGGGSKETAQAGQGATMAGVDAVGGAPSVGAAGEAPGALAGMSPVPDAMAATGGGEGCGCEPAEPAKPLIVDAACDQKLVNSPTIYAIAEFPGKSAAELAGVIAVVNYPDLANTTYKWPEGFSSQATTVLVQDGSVAIGCGSQTTPSLSATSVRFLLR